MQSWRRFRSLSAADRLIVAEAAGLLLLIRVAMPMGPFRLLRRVLRAYARVARARVCSGSDESARIVWAVVAAGRHLRLRTTCLMESLAVDAMLRRRGIAAEIRFGVKRPDGSVLSAHAWVERDGAVVFDSRPDLSDYSVLIQQDPR